MKDTWNNKIKIVHILLFTLSPIICIMFLEKNTNPFHQKQFLKKLFSLSISPLNLYCFTRTEHLAQTYSSYTIFHCSKLHFTLFLKCLFLRARALAGEVWAGQRIRSRLHADSREPHVGLANPPDHDLSQSWKLNWRSQPGAPKLHLFLNLQVTICFMLYTSFCVNMFLVILSVRILFSRRFLRKSFIRTKFYWFLNIYWWICTLYIWESILLDINF